MTVDIYEARLEQHREFFGPEIDGRSCHRAKDSVGDVGGSRVLYKGAAAHCFEGISISRRKRGVYLFLESLRRVEITGGCSALVGLSARKRRFAFIDKSFDRFLVVFCLAAVNVVCRLHI